MWLFDLASGFVSFLLGLIPLKADRVRGSLTELRARYPRSVVHRVEFPRQEDAAEPVEFVVANRTGLSFRDAYGGELLKVPNPSIERLVALPGDGSVGYGWDVLRVRGVPLARFWCAEDITSELVEALGRPGLGPTD